GLTQPQRPATAPSKTTQPPAANSGEAKDGVSTSPSAQEKVIPAAAERHFHEGVQFKRDGDTENAIQQFKDAIKEYPDYFEAHASLGALYLDRKGYADAIAELKTAISLRSNDANVHNNLGLALKHDRDLDGAIAQYQAAIRINPKFADAQGNLANVLYS